MSCEMIIRGTHNQATIMMSYRAKRKCKKEAVTLLERVRFLHTGKAAHIRYWQDDAKSTMLAEKEPDSDFNNSRDLEVLGITNIATKTRRGRAIGLKKLEEAYEVYWKLDNITAR